MKCRVLRYCMMAVVLSLDAKVGIQVWNHLTNTTECQMSGHSDWVWSVVFSYDERHVVSGSLDKTVRIWDCPTVNEVSIYQHSNKVTCVTFSRDGGRVAIGSWDSG